MAAPSGLRSRTGRGGTALVCRSSRGSYATQACRMGPCQAPTGRDGLCLAVAAWSADPGAHPDIPSARLRMITEPSYGPDQTAAIVERTTVAVHRAHISWISIFGGWVVAMGIAWLFYVLGLAVGFSSFDLTATEAVSKGIGIGTTIWVILTWAASLFVGAMFASWVDGRADTTVGALHGGAVWGLALTITTILTAFGVSNFRRGAAAGRGRGARAAGAAG